MTRNRVNSFLFMAIVVMAMLPLVASLYFVNAALDTSLNIGFNPDVSEVLDASAENLKILAHLDGQNQEKYRQEFEQTQNLRMVYKSRDFVRESVRHSLLIYFAIGTIASLIVSISLAAVLSRKISASFKLAYTQVHAQQEKIRYLEEISSWQELAKILAHEIKNPLTPIEMLITSLTKSYRDRSGENFSAFLAHVQTVVLEELSQLKTTVQKFSAFAQLPSIHAEDACICEVLEQHITAINNTVQDARVILAKPSNSEPGRLKLDKTLFRQVLNNLVRNGIEANPGVVVIFSVSIHWLQDTVEIYVMNDGVKADPEIVPRMFDPYISTRKAKENMGLGLAIVRKILLEHGGDIRYEVRQGFPLFVIALPKGA